MERESEDLVGGFLAAVAALLLFGWLATHVLGNSTLAFDAAVRNGIHAWASAPLTMFFRVVTVFGSELWLVPFGGVAAWRLVKAGRRHAAGLFLLAAAGGETLDYLLKILFHRARPEVFFGYTSPRTYSFPSGHAMLSACFYGVLAALIAAGLPSRGQRVAVWTGAAMVALLIGISRIYLGVHYPSDVVAGYAAAIVWVFSIRAGYVVWLRRSVRLRPLPGSDAPVSE